MREDNLYTLVKKFFCSSKSVLYGILKEIRNHKPERKQVSLFIQDGKKRVTKSYDGSHFFLRTSFEYSSPQLTLEELQGIVAARLLEACSNHLLNTEVSDLGYKDIEEIVEILRKPPAGKVIPFILETDDVEPDRYSNNPFRRSIIESGQSAFPVLNVTMKGLKFDRGFTAKYSGSLISDWEVEFGERHLEEFEWYVDFVNFFKVHELSQASKVLNIELNIPMLSMPLEALRREKGAGPLHSAIEESHKDYETIERIYRLMGRSISKKTLLPTVPHSAKGFGSKRCARGRLIFSGRNLVEIKVRYQTTTLYPNMADPNDLSVAEADDEFKVPAQRLLRYSFTETPSSPQFVLYILLSPEDASLWHGVGEYEGSELLKSYTAMQSAFLKSEILEGIERQKTSDRPPMALNLPPDKIWIHPKYGNIDASVGCVKDMYSLLLSGIKVTTLTLKR